MAFRIPRLAATALVATALLGTAGVALAQGWHGGWGGPGGGMDRLMETFDTNKDGKLTQAEVDAYRNDQLAKFDKDGNGELNLEEYQALWADAMRRNDFEAAYSAALEYREPNFFWRELMLGACLGHLGRVEEATACGTQLLRVKPQFAHRGRRLIAYYVKSDELRDTIVEGLRKAGVEVA